MIITRQKYLDMLVAGQGKRSLYGLRGISVKIHPFVHLSTDVVHGFLVGNAESWHHNA